MRGHRLFLKAGSVFSRIFSTPLNPLYHLGTTAIYMFTIAFISGVYLFLFYNVDPTQSYNSTIRIMDQWLGNVMRNLHRYSSDAFVIFVFLHFLHMLITGKFKRVTSWIFGIISLIITIFIGLTGFVLVWDQKAKLLGLLTAKLLIYLPIFDPSIAGAFLNNDLAYLGGVFRVVLFAHVFFCAFTAIFLWLHEMHLSKAGVFPPKKIMLFSGIFLLGISLFWDASIDPPAQDSVLPLETTFDWYYFFGYYFMKILPVGGNWILMLIVTALLIAFPFLFRKKRPPLPDIDRELCDACEQCIEDCPYEAITLKPYPEGGDNRALIDYNKCVGCNICVGSCKSMAISSEAVAPDILSFAEDAHHVVACQSLGVNKMELPPGTKYSEVVCIGNANAKSLNIDQIKDENKLILVGCETCYYRFGVDWAKVRINRKRRPVSAPSVNFNNILFLTSGQNIGDKIRQFTLESGNKERKKAVSVVEWTRPNWIVAIVISLLFFLTIPVLSNVRMHFYSPTERTVILNLKYISSPVEESEGSSSRLSHMQSPVPIVTRRSDILIEAMDEQGSVIYSKVFRPRGLRRDVAVYVYDEIQVPGTVSVTLREVSFPEKSFSMENIALDPGQSILVRFDNQQLVH